jgi:soluble lytic murein transglycosylase-like protein
LNHPAWYNRITLKRLALFVLLAGLGIRGVSAQLAYYVDERGRRVYVNPEPKPDRSVQNPVVSGNKSSGTAHNMRAANQPLTKTPIATSRTASRPGTYKLATYAPPAEPAHNSAAPVRSSKGTALDAANEARPSLESLVEQTALRHDVDVNLIRAMIHTESNNDPRAVSNKGALGLMQLMPFTARDLGVTNVFDPVQNVDGGVRYLKSLLTQFGGDLPLSLAAYNAGPGAVTRHGGIPPYRETQDYVKKIGSLYGSLRLQAQKPRFQGITRTVDETGRVIYTNLP